MEKKTDTQATTTERGGNPLRWVPPELPPAEAGVGLGCGSGGPGGGSGVGGIAYKVMRPWGGGDLFFLLR